MGGLAMRILLVEDDRSLAEAVLLGLEEEGYLVDHAATGSDGRLYVATRHYDLIILDRMLPEVSGDHLLAGWRRQGKSTPVLMLTALDAVADRVTGLRGGADDYLVKPFAFDELLARLEALGRRGAFSSGLQVGGLSLDHHTGELVCEDRRVRLTPREYRMMELFLRRPGQVLTRQMIAASCWEEPEETSDNVMEVHIKNLRKRIAVVSERPWLQTRRGLGYVLEANP